jgi:hypothetical protein
MSDEDSGSGCLGSLVFLAIIIVGMYAVLSTVMVTTPTYIQRDKQNYACWAEDFKVVSPERTKWNCVKVEFNLYGKVIK